MAETLFINMFPLRAFLTQPLCSKSPFDPQVCVTEDVVLNFVNALSGGDISYIHRKDTEGKDGGKGENDKVLGK